MRPVAFFYYLTVKLPGWTIFWGTNLEKLKASNNKTKIRMVGILTFTEDVTPELVRETIESIKVCGTIKVLPDVQEVLNTLH